MIVPICDQVRVCDWCSLGPASLFGHWRCPAWSLTLTTWLHSFQNKYLSPTKLIWTHGIMGSPEPYGALLTNDRPDQQCSVDGVMGPSYGPSLRGRQVIWDQTSHYSMYLLHCKYCVERAERRVLYAESTCCNIHSWQWSPHSAR